jgi:hypothetical protein
MQHRDLWTGWALAMALTVATGRLPRTMPAGPVVTLPVAAPGFVVQGDGSVDVEEGVARLSSTSADGVEWWHGLRLARGGAWHLEAEARQGHPGDPLRVVLRSEGPDDPLWFGTPRVRSPEWVTTRRRIDADLTERPLRIGAVARGEGAVLEVRALRLVPIRPTVGFPLGMVVSTLAWTAVAAGVSWRVAQQVDRRMVGMLVVLGGLAVLGALVPLEALRAAGVSAVVQKVVGHAGGFAVLGAVLQRAGAPAGATVARLAAVGVALEALQVWSVSRSAAPEDVVLDVTGAALGWWLAHRARGERS